MLKKWTHHRNIDIYNLLFSYGIKDDINFLDQGHIFLGAGDDNGSELHVWLKKGDHIIGNDRGVNKEGLEKLREIVNACSESS